MPDSWGPTRSVCGRAIAGRRMLAVEHLVAGYGRRPLARLGRLEVGPGEAALLLGPSGSGKTTLLLAIAGMAAVIEGSGRIDEGDMAGPSGAERERDPRQTTDP